MCRVVLLAFVAFSCLHHIVCHGLGNVIDAAAELKETKQVSQPLPPDASPYATPDFDVHPGRCSDVRFDCDSKPIRYYCTSDLTCFRFQKCCLYNCNYVCTKSASAGWRNANDTEPDPYSVYQAVIPADAIIMENVPVEPNAIAGE